jgi:hypothetical protein
MSGRWTPFAVTSVAFCCVLLFAQQSIRPSEPSESRSGSDESIFNNARRMLHEGQGVFRFDTFGDEEFWGDTLKLHQAIEGARLGRTFTPASPTRSSSRWSRASGRG